MRIHRVLLSLIAVVAAAAPDLASAQWPSPSKPQVQWPDPPSSQTAPKAAPKAKPAPRARTQQDVEELTPGQIQRAQEAETSSGATPKAAQPPAKAKPKGSASRAIACSGAFARNSSHLRLAQAFGSQNITFTEVDGPDNTKLMASVLYPKDPRQRLEVLWENEASRSDLQLIVINGRSSWNAPKGLRLGLSLASIEKLNGKPFKLRTFDASGATILDWQGGALASLPGGCKINMRLVMDSKAPGAARDKVAKSKELVSSDPGVKAVRPAIAEILLGY
jgi:hypothetical protein